MNHITNQFYGLTEGKEQTFVNGFHQIFHSIHNTKKFEIGKKYQFLDEIFLRVLEKHPKKMSEIFFKMFQSSPKTIIKFLSNKSNFLEDLTIILKMPKWIFIKALFY